MRRLLRLPDASCLGLAFLLRLGFVLRLGEGLYQADEIAYDLLGWTLAQTGTFGDGTRAVIQPPLPCAFFAAFFKLCGRHRLAPRLGQALLGTGVAWLIARFVRDITGSAKCGKLALILAGVYPFFIYYGGMLTSETLYVAASVSGLWFLCRSLREKGAPLWEAMTAGAALGLSGLCRTEGAGIFAIILLCALACAQGFRRSLALALICFALPLCAWSWRNHHHSGHWTLDEHAGTSLLHGTIVFEQNEVDTADAMEALHGMKFWQDGWRLPEHEREKFFTQVAFQYMRDHPGKTAGQWGRKFFNFWRFYPRQDKAYVGVPGNNPAAGFKRPLMTAVSLLFEPALIVGGLWGLWSLGRRLELMPLWLFVLGTNAVHVVSVSQMRYRLPIMPVLMLGFCFLLSGSKDARRVLI